jgi:hypothetical protein
MRKLVLLMTLSVMLLLTQKAAAGGRETHFKVVYTCICSPNCQGQIVGEWDLACDESLTGWGWEPGSSCTATEVTYGAWCGPDHQ